MKLKNKLIPLIATSAVCATAMPIALASCSNNGMVDLVDGYAPTITRAKQSDVPFRETSYFEDTMLDFYMGAVKNNPDILVQDNHWTMATQTGLRLDKPEGVVIKELKELKQSISNVNVEMIKVPCSIEGNSKDFWTWTMSYDLEQKMDVIIDDEVQNNGMETTTEYISTVKYSFKHLPVKCSYRNDKKNQIGEEGSVSYLDMSDYSNWFFDLCQLYLVGAGTDMPGSPIYDWSNIDLFVKEDSEVEQIITIKEFGKTRTQKITQAAHLNCTTQADVYDWFNRILEESYSKEAFKAANSEDNGSSKIIQIDGNPTRLAFWSWYVADIEEPRW